MFVNVLLPVPPAEKEVKAHVNIAYVG